MLHGRVHVSLAGSIVYFDTTPDILPCSYITVALGGTGLIGNGIGGCIHDKFRADGSLIYDGFSGIRGGIYGCIGYFSHEFNDGEKHGEVRPNLKIEKEKNGGNDKKSKVHTIMWKK